MVFRPPPPAFFSFKVLAEKWGVLEELIEDYVISGKIEFVIDDLRSKTPVEERNRIYRLLPALNEYAGKDVDRLEQKKRFKTKKEQSLWSDHRHLDSLFSLWLNYYGWEINKIRIVIPLAEVERFENEHGKPDSTSPDVKETVKIAGQTLAALSYNKEGRDQYVVIIMKAIKEKMKLAPPNCLYINHGRFIEEAEVPDNLRNSVRNQVKSQIAKYWNDTYKPLSRAPKKNKVEDYFLLI
jgi:hypothetical protein